MTKSPAPIDSAKVEDTGEHIDIVFDQVAVDGAPPEYSFIEVENSQRYSISFGEWVHRDDGYWVLRIGNEVSAATRAYWRDRFANYGNAFTPQFLRELESKGVAAPTPSTQAVGEPDLLKEIAQRLTIMLMSASCYTDPRDDDIVTGYRVKTGAMHRIIGLLECAGYTVSVPSNMPVESVDLTPVAWINPSLIDRLKITPWLHVLITASSDLDEGVTMPLYDRPASPAASVLTDAILAIAIDHGLGTAVVESIAKALLAASMGVDPK